MYCTPCSVDGLIHVAGLAIRGFLPMYRVDEPARQVGGVCRKVVDVGVKQTASEMG